MKFWDSELGIWTLLKTKVLWIHGTTPRNADVWSLDIDTPRYSVWFSTGQHASVLVWKKEDIVWTWELDTTNCRCFIHEYRTFTPKEIEALNRALNDPQRPTRKLPPRENV